MVDNPGQTNLYFEESVGGARVRARVQVSTPDGSPISGDQQTFAQRVLSYIQQAAAGYSQSSSNPMGAAAEAGELVKLVQELRGVGSNPPLLMAYFGLFRETAEDLLARDARFAPAFFLAGHGENLAGDFRLTAIPGVIERMAGLLPQHTPSGLEFPGGAPEPMVVISSIVDANTGISCVIEADQPNFAVLRDLGMAAEMVIKAAEPFAPVDFYSCVAQAKTLCNLASSDLFRENAQYRAALLEALEFATDIIADCDENLRFSHRFTLLAQAADEKGWIDETLEFVEACSGWLPQDLREGIPGDWVRVSDQKYTDMLMDAFRERFPGRFVAVMDGQSNEDFQQTGLSKVDAFLPLEWRNFDREFVGKKDAWLFRWDY